MLVVGVDILTISGSSWIKQIDVDPQCDPNWMAMTEQIIFPKLTGSCSDLESLEGVDVSKKEPLKKHLKVVDFGD